ncbi:MAG: hemolysin family protein [Chloroflexota bacterium]|nr:hemolysin family protein [Chloroflexota bacterium]
MLLLVLANGFFVATEFALVSVRRTRVQQLAAEGHRQAEKVLAELNHLDTYIAATQLGITMASLALGWIGEPAVASLIEPLIHSLGFIPEGSRDAITHTVSFAVGFSLITTLHIVIGELAPKSLALQRPEQTAMFAAGPIHWFYLAFRPAIVGLNTIGNAVVRLFGIDPASGHQLVQSAEELRLAVDASREAGLVEESAHDLVDRALLFPDLEARHAMVPRTEITAVPLDADLETVLAAVAASGHSRLPVYDGDIDHVVGVIDVKRLLPTLLASASVATTGSASPFSVPEVMTTVLAVPETASASDLLPRLRAAEAPFAIVIDEYGGTAGLITLVDLVESLVGEISDEFEPSSENGRRTADGSFSLDGLTTLMEAKEFYDLDLEDDDVETIGGFVFSCLGRPAVVGDEVVTEDGQILRVEEIDGLRVARVWVGPARGEGNEAAVPAGQVV